VTKGEGAFKCQGSNQPGEKRKGDGQKAGRCREDRKVGLAVHVLLSSEGS